MTMDGLMTRAIQMTRHWRVNRAAAAGDRLAVVGADASRVACKDGSWYDVGYTARDNSNSLGAPWAWTPPVKSQRWPWAEMELAQRH